MRSHLSYICPYPPTYLIPHSCRSIVSPRQTHKIYCWLRTRTAISIPIRYICHITRSDFYFGDGRLELD
jgi:hypothetical protein